VGIILKYQIFRKRERVLERGAKPSSQYFHPSPANENSGFSTIIQAGEGQGVRLIRGQRVNSRLTN
jgi:hypothetical protein